MKDSVEYTQLPQPHVEMNEKGDQYDNQDNDQLMDLMEFNIDKLKFPSFNAMNSLVSDVTNIFSTQLVPGPASSFSAIYTAQKQSQKISLWAFGNTGKAVISLDLDLYDKCYLLVNSRNDMREQFILCLGELHAVFAHIRAIGSYISGSGIDNAWLSAGWFGSCCLARQVIECVNMKRAIALLLKEVFADHQELLEDRTELYTFIMEIREALESDNVQFLKLIWNSFSMKLESLVIEEKVNTVIEKRKENKILQFILGFCRLVKRLFIFIESIRTRN